MRCTRHQMPMFVTVERFLRWTCIIYRTCISERRIQRYMIAIMHAHVVTDV